MQNIVEPSVTGSGGGYSPGAVRLQCRIGFWDMVGHIVLWIVMILLTLGIAAFFFVYSLQKMVVNHTVMVNRQGAEVGHLRCDFNIVSTIGHVILWILLTIITLGLALPFYIYRVNRVIMDETEVVIY